MPAGVSVCGACLINPPPYTRVFAALDYAYPWDGLITHFKFHAALDLAPTLCLQMLAQRDFHHAASNTLPLSLLLPMPLSVERLRERGYNQAWELARRLAGALRCPADAHLLLRIKHTPQQISLPRAQRVSNVRAAFAVEPRRLSEVRGAHITLVDDVMTTGATAAEAARTLLQAGAAEVHVWVAARTPKHGDT
jgi:ComF family protein